jgi:hypothetical protein
MEGIRKDDKSRPYRVDFFNWDEMQKDMALVRSVVLRTCTAKEAKGIVMGGPIPANNKVLSKISYAGHSWRSIIRAYRFYRKLADEPVRKTYVAVENLFPGKKAVDVMEYIAAHKDEQHSRPTASATVMTPAPVVPNIVPGVWTDEELNDPETWKGVCDNETLDMVDERVSALKNWALEAITGVKRSPHQQITAEETAMLQSGMYTDANGKIMLFTLPKELEQLLEVELRNLMSDVDTDEVIDAIAVAEAAEAAEKRCYAGGDLSVGDVTSTISFHIPQPDFSHLCPSTFSPDVVKAYSVEAQFPDGVIAEPEPPTTGPDSPATKAVVEDLNGMMSEDEHEQIMETFIPNIASTDVTTPRLQAVMETEEPFTVCMSDGKLGTLDPTATNEAIKAQAIKTRSADPMMIDVEELKRVEAIEAAQRKNRPLTQEERDCDRTLNQMEFETQIIDTPPEPAPSKPMYPCERVNGFVWLGVSAVLVAGIVLYCLFHR